jgi:hypothetical protein
MGGPTLTPATGIVAATATSEAGTVPLHLVATDTASVTGRNHPNWRRYNSSSPHQGRMFCLMLWLECNRIEVHRVVCVRGYLD